jgi:hypothetical protein
MCALPVREMVLYKHGVGFFVREGAVEGNEVAITFRQDEINDVLKSLAVFDRAGGQVLGIHYQTPMDRAARLANSSIDLADRYSLRDLLRDLRGRRATLNFETTPGTTETVTGRVIGIDQPAHVESGGPDAYETFVETVSILAEDGQVRVWRLETLRSVDIHDTQSGHDLSYFLDTSMGMDSRRIVTVRLSEGEHQLAMSYVVPSPTWRVSYRIVAESDESGETGKALLQGWGLFDNRLEEDLEDVQVTLVAGQPISFIYDLYASRVPRRPIVQDEARIAPGPIEYESAFDALDEESLVSEQTVVIPALREIAHARPTSGMYVGSAGSANEADLRLSKSTTRAGIARSQPAQAQGQEAGEFFQYVVTTPVSVKRGESALVPIIGSEVSYQRELLYNGAKLPKHPVAALRFKNATGLTLERGPVTVVEDGDYKGEAVVPFTKDGTEVYLPYAVELGVRVTERVDYQVQIASLSIKDAYFIYEQYHTTATTYLIENTTAKPVTILIEALIQNGYELFDTRTPDVETANERRWRINVPARTRTEFVRKDRYRTERREEVRRLSYQNLQGFFENRWLDRQTLEWLREMLDNMALIQNAQAEQDKLAKENKAIYERQEQLRANLGALSPTGQEAGLRNRMLGQMEKLHNRLEETDRRLSELTEQITAANERIDQIIAGLA